MSNMLVSLLLKVREEGAGVIGKVREGLQNIRTDDKLGQSIGQTIAYNLKQGAFEARGLAEGIGEARKRGGELYETIVHSTLGIGAMVYAFKKGFLDIAVDAEQLRTRLEAIEGTPGRAEAAFSWLKDFRSHTASTMAEVTEAWIELREHGVRPTSLTMKALADASVASGISIAQVARTFGNVISEHAVGRMRELGVEMIDRGGMVAVRYHYLGKVITETFSKLNREALAGGLTRIMGLLHDGAAEKASQGLAGTLMTMSEAWEDFAREVMEKGGVLKFLTQQFREFSQGGEEMAEGQKSNAEALADTFKEIIRYGFEFASFIRSYLPPAIEHVKRFVAAVGGIKVVALAVVGVLAAPFAAALLSIGGSVLSLVISGIGLLASGLVGLSAVLISTVIPAIFSMGVALLTTPIGWIIMLIGGLAAAAYFLYENWATALPYLKEAWDWVKFFTPIGPILMTIQKLIDIAPRIPAAWEAVKSFFVDLWNVIAHGWDTTIGRVERGVEWLKNHLPNMAGIAPGYAPDTGAGTGLGPRNTVDGRVKVDINVTSDGRASGRVTESGASGPLDIDPSLGFAMSF